MLLYNIYGHELHAYAGIPRLYIYTSDAVYLILYQGFLLLTHPGFLMIKC